MKYLDRLNLKAEEKDQAANVLAATHALHAVEQRISQLKAEGATLNAAYEASLSKKPFNVDAVIDIKIEAAKVAERLTAAQEIAASQF